MKLTKIKKLKKLVKSFFVLFLVISWLLTSWPQIPFINFPPGVKTAWALDVANGDGILFYAASANTTPQFRTYINSTNDFSANAGTVAGAQPAINQIKTSPAKQEAIAAYQDTSGNLRVLCYNGTTWTEDWTIAVAPSGTPTTRRFDIAYETNTGDVTVAYSRNTAAANALAYRTKAGSSGCGSANWAAAANFPTTTTVTSATVMWVRAARDGRSAQNLSAWVWLDNAATNADLGGAIWSGSAFTNFKSIETSMEHQTAVGDSDNFDVQYESLSGDVMVVWGNSAGASATNGYRYMTCTGGTSSCTWSALTTLPGPLDDVMTIDLSADPLSNKMAMAGCGGASFDVSAGYWDGTGPWTGYANVDTSCETTALVGSKRVTTGWLTNTGNTKWYISYDDGTGFGLSYKYAIDGGTITTATDYTSTPALTDLRGRYDTDMNPFNNAELIQTVSDDTNNIFAYKLSMDTAGNLSWSDMATAVSLGTKPSHPQQGFSYTYWRFIPATTTLGADVANDPGATTVAPGSGIRSAGQFIFTTSSGSDTIPDLTLTLGGSPAGSYAAVDSVSIRATSCAGTLYFSAVAPSSDSVSFSGGTALAASTGGNTYLICITPKDHTLASGTYSVSPYISSTWTSGNGNTKAGTDSNAYALTIDNASPAGTTGAGATSGENTQSTVSWTNPGDTDFQQVYIYCKTSSMVIGEAPTEGTDPTVDGTACGATAKLKYKGTASPQIISGLTNGTPYYFRIYARDTNGNFTAYSATQEVSGTPSAAASIFTQNKYLWYVDNDLVDPTAVWGTPDLIENQAIVVVPPGNDPPGPSQEVRLRVNYVVKTADMPVSGKYFKLEYKAGTDGICTTGSWTDVGTGVWVYATSTVTDGADIVKVLSDTTAGKGEEYVKSKPSQVNHVAALTNEIIEYDFHIVGTSATANSQYSFRVVETNSGGTSETVFDTYTNCPTLTTEPGTANLLRHGNVFTEGLEKGFFWTD